MKTQGWGGYPVSESALERPSSVDELRPILKREKDLLARGMGRSYGDSALSGQLIETAAFDLLQSFDTETGMLHCQAGVTLDTILRVFVPRGWFLPVTPGTRYVSVGGAIASDVHGKNHHLAGSFSEMVASFTLLLADGSLVSCSHDEHSDLYQATCGGMGLTGIIIDAALRLRPIRSAFVEQRTLKAANLHEAMHLFEEHEQATYSVAWIDCLARGSELGRSLLMLGEHANDGKLSLPERSELTVPFHTPALMLNRYSVAAFNALYYARARSQELSHKVDYRKFFYPLDGIAHWNRLYGRKGFLQYQFALPHEAGREGMTAILKHIANSGRGSFLAVLKALGHGNGHPLSFPIKGYSLALDFKVTHGVFFLLNELDSMVAAYGGRLYLAKDARMSETFFKTSYPQWRTFQETRARYGAIGIFSSLQSRRLGLD